MWITTGVAVLPAVVTTTMRYLIVFALGAAVSLFVGFKFPVVRNFADSVFARFFVKK
jgi:hypothetical protein